MRLFFAISIPEDLKEKINAFIKDSGITGSMVLKDNYHITLKFLGEVSEDELNGIMDNAKKISFSSFNCSLKDLGFFGQENQPTVLFINVLKGFNEIISLNNLIHEKTMKYGQDFRFHPHLTLARNPVIPKNINDYNFSSDEFQVKEYCLMESIIKNGKIFYKKIKSFELK